MDEDLGIGEARPSFEDLFPVATLPSSKGWDPPVDVVAVLLDYLSARDIIACTLVAPHWRDTFHTAIASKAQALLTRFFPSYDRVTVDNPRETLLKELRAVLNCPLQECNFSLVWPNRAKEPVPTPYGDCFVRRRGKAPELQFEYFRVDEGFVYNDGLVAWQFSWNTFFVDDLEQGCWRMYELPYDVAFDAIPRLYAVTKDMVVLSTYVEPDDIELELAQNHHMLIFDRESDSWAPLTFANEDSQIFAHQDILVILHQEVDPNDEFDAWERIVRYQMKYTRDGEFRRQLEMVELDQVREEEIHVGGLLFDDNDKHTYFTVREDWQHDTVLIREYKRGALVEEYELAIRHQTDQPPKYPNRGSAGKNVNFELTWSCRRADSRGTWEICTTDVRRSSTVSALYFHVPSRKFHWRQYPMRRTHFKGPADSDMRTTGIRWNGWAYDIDLLNVTENTKRKLTARETMGVSRKMHASACSDPSDVDLRGTPLVKEAICTYRFPGALDMTVLKQDPRIFMDDNYLVFLFMDDNYLVFPVGNGGGYGLVSFGEPKPKVLKQLRQRMDSGIHREDRHNTLNQIALEEQKLAKLIDQRKRLLADMAAPNKDDHSLDQMPSSPHPSELGDHEFVWRAR